MADWGQKREELNKLHKELQQKPMEAMMGYSLSAGGILNAYREGDISFEDACNLLEMKSQKEVKKAWLTEKEAKELELGIARKELERKLDQLTQSLARAKICPILMAGTMLNNICEINVSLYYESPRCMREKCEWFENGCPAHPKVELEYKLGTIKPLPQR